MDRINKNKVQVYYCSTCSHLVPIPDEEARPVAPSLMLGLESIVGQATCYNCLSRVWVMQLKDGLPTYVTYKKRKP